MVQWHYFKYNNQDLFKMIEKIYNTVKACHDLLFDVMEFLFEIDD